MADEEKEKSTDKILQALDALSQLYQARANRRTTSLALPRSGSAKDGDDARAADVAAVEEAQPRPRVRHPSSLTSPSLSKPKLEKNENDDDKKGDDAALIIIIKIQGLSADESRPQRRRLSLMLPFRCRSKLDLNLFAKESTDKCQQGECVRRRDMVFPLAGKAKGGELVVKLPFHSIDDGSAGEYKTSSKMLTPKIRSSEVQKKVVDKTRRKLRRYLISNMLTPKMSHTKTPKMGVPAPDLRGIDSFKLDEPEPEPNPIDEVKETQQKEPEREPADEPTPVIEVKEELRQKEPQSEPADESTPVAEVKEDEQQNEPEREPADEPTPVAEVKEDAEQKEPEREPEDAEEDDESELPELDVIDKGIEGQEVKVELKEEDEAKKGSVEKASVVRGDEVAKVVANGLEEKSVEATMPSDVWDAVVDAVKPVNGEAARPEESLQVLEQGEDKGAAAKPPRPRFKWRTVGLLVPIAVLVSNTLGGKR